MFCLCRCHFPTDALIHDQRGADLTDVVEAAAACPVCVNGHTPALSSRRPKVEREKTAWVDAPPGGTPGANP